MTALTLTEGQLLALLALATTSTAPGGPVLVAAVRAQINQIPQPKETP